MNEKTWTLLLICFLLITPGIVLYFRFRIKINKVLRIENLNTLLIHFRKYRYWYLTALAIILIPLLYHFWDILFHPSRVKTFIPPNVPPSTTSENPQQSFVNESYPTFSALIEAFSKQFLICWGMLVLSYLLFFVKLKNPLNNFTFKQSIAIMYSIGLLIILGIIFMFISLLTSLANCPGCN